MTVANSGFNQKIAGFGTLSYANGDPSVVSIPSINYGGISTSTNVVSLDETVIEMLTPSPPSEKPNQTFILTTGRIQKAWKWSLNGDNPYSLALEAENPLLWDPQSATNSPLVIATKNNTWVDIIFSLSGDMSTLQPSHPFHKHSNRVYVLVSPKWIVPSSFSKFANFRVQGLRQRQLQLDFGRRRCQGHSRKL